MEEKEKISAEKLSYSLIEIAVESWRFARLFARLLQKMDSGEISRYQSQFRWYVRRLEECLDAVGFHVVNIEGQPFDTGMAATPINLSDFSPDDALMVDQMVEPIIMGPEGLCKTGSVILRKVER